MKRHGTPMKARIDKRLTEKGARKRYEIDFSREGEIDQEEMEAMHALAEYEYDVEEKARELRAFIKAIHNKDHRDNNVPGCPFCEENDNG